MNTVKNIVLKYFDWMLNNPAKLFGGILLFLVFSVMIDTPALTRNILIAFYSELSKKPITELSLINRVLFICIIFSFVFVIVLLFRTVENWLKPKFYLNDNCLWKWQYFKKSFEKMPYCPTHVYKMEKLSKKNIREYYEISNVANGEHEIFDDYSSILHREDEYRISEDSFIYHCPIKKCSKDFQKFRSVPSDNINDEYFSDMKYHYLTEIDRPDLLERI